MISALLALALAAPVDAQFLAAVRKRVPRVRAGNRQGSGVVVKANPLTVATCFHVVRDSESIVVEAPAEGLRAAVTQVVVHPGNDLAFLRANVAWPEAMAWSEASLSTGDPVITLGFGHGDGSKLLPLQGLLLAGRLRLHELASQYQVQPLPPASFRVADLTDGQVQFRQGDSGGAVVDAEGGHLLGLVAGSIIRTTHDDVSNFAILPPGAIPPDGDFRPVHPQQGSSLLDETRGSLPYGDDNGVIATSLVLRTRLIDAQAPVEIPVPDGGVSQVEQACTDAVEEALDQAVVPPGLPADAGVGPGCGARYAALRDVELALRAQQARVDGLNDYALKVDLLQQRLEMELSQQVDEEWTGPTKEALACGGRKCPRLEESYVVTACQGRACSKLTELADVKQKSIWEKVAAAFYKKVTSSDLKSMTQLPARPVLQAVAIPASAGPEVKALAKEKDASAERLLAKAFGGPVFTVSQSKSSSQLAWLTLAPSEEGSPREVIEKAAAQKQEIVQALARRKRELLTALAAGGAQQ